MPKHTSPVDTVSIYPHTPWAIVEDTFQPAYNERNETMFALGNGYLGTRGSFEEGLAGAPEGTPALEGTYVNAFYESEDIHYPEPAYGLAEASQTMLNVTNGKIVRLFVEDEPFSMFSGTVSDYRRTLDLKTGVLERALTWRSPAGRTVRIVVRRLVSFADKHLMAISFQVTPLDFSGKIRLVAVLDGNVENKPTDKDPRAGSGLRGRVLQCEQVTARFTGAVLWQRTTNTKFELACAMETALIGDYPYSAAPSAGALSAQVEYILDATQGQPITLEKFVAYVTSRDMESDKVQAAARQSVLDGKQAGFEALARLQAAFLADFWHRADVEIEGDPATEQGLRVNMFHLLQGVGRDGRTNIAAKALTGEGYEGHYFWDTEMYVVPFFLYNSPDIARKLLEYRYGILEKARERARTLSHPRGALFPWRTIAGEECSAYFPAGTAQYHIDADIAFAIRQYIEVTGDHDFLRQYGAEILFETARLWADLGHYNTRRGEKFGKFCIDGVTGPDEYTAIVNNNCYTNLMAQVNLSYAYEVAGWLKDSAPADYQRIAAATGLEESEPAAWRKAAEAMYVPYDADLGLYLQDDAFLDKAPWDFEASKGKHPLLNHYHSLVIYRHQICKQADLVLALFLRGDRFTQAEKAANYAYYKQVTTHDSSLSKCVFSIVASEIGERDEAYHFFTDTARMDLDDLQGNVKDGIHAANMAGTWMSLVNGFGGMRARSGELRFRPYLPNKWTGYRFRITYRQRLIEVSVNTAGSTYTLLEGDPLTVWDGDDPIRLEAGKPIQRRQRKNV